MTARLITTIALVVLPLVACTDSPTPASTYTPNPASTSTPNPASTSTPSPTPIPADRIASSLEDLRAADVALIDAFAAVNGAFINTAAANASFANELAALNAYAATLHKALEAYHVALEIALDSYTGAVEGLVGIAAYDQLDFYETGVAALAAMLIVRAAAYEAYDTAREVGYQGIQDAAYNATGELERIAALDAFTKDSDALLAASKDFSTASEAIDVATYGLTYGLMDALDITSERTPSRHGSDYVMAVLAALDAVDQGAVREAAREAAREAYSTSPKAAFDAAFNLMQVQYSSAIAAVPVLTYTPRPVNTPKPTSVPVSVGTGIALEQIQAPFEKLGFDFFKGSALDDNDRLIDYWVGETFDPLARLEIYGSSNNLTKIEMAVGAPFDEVKGAYLGLFLSLVLPESEVEGGANWMIDNIDEALDGAKPEMKSEGLLSISMWYMSALNFLWVTVTGG